MKFVKIITLIFVCAIFFSCEDDEVVLDHELIGQWQVVEFWDDIIDPNNIYDVQGVNEPVENGRVIEFNANGEFINEHYGCMKGKYYIKKNSIRFVCNDKSVPEFVLTYRIDEENRLHLYAIFEGEVCEKI